MGLAWLEGPSQTPRLTQNPGLGTACRGWRKGDSLHIPRGSWDADATLGLRCPMPGDEVTPTQASAVEGLGDAGPGLGWNRQNTGMKPRWDD